MESNRDLVEAARELLAAIDDCLRMADVWEIKDEMAAVQVALLKHSAALASPAAQPVEEVKVSGYAPGDYHCRCRDCGEIFDGDKRAWQCLKCATRVSSASAQPPEDQPQAVTLDDGDRVIGYDDVKHLLADLRSNYTVAPGDKARMDDAIHWMEDQGNWYERRYNRLAKWAREELPEEQQVRFFHIMANGQPQAQSPEDQSKAPTCSTCSDTHVVWSAARERDENCTRCPTPCQKCRKDGIGAYCTSAPCSCECHRAPPEPFMQEGAWYERRDGKVVGPASQSNIELYTWLVGGHLVSSHYTDRGSYYRDYEEDHRDLIRRVPAPGQEGE